MERHLCSLARLARSESLIPVRRAFLHLAIMILIDAPVTLVEDATHVSEGAVIATALESLTVDVQCGIAGVNAVCTEKINDAASATTIVESGVVEFVPVPIQVGTGPITSAGSSLPTSASITFVSGTATSSVVSQTSISVLPPVLSTSRASTSSIATVVTPSALNPTASSASGASRVATTGLAMLLPILAMMLVS